VEEQPFGGTVFFVLALDLRGLSPVDFKSFAARVNSCPDTNQDRKSGFFRKLFGPGVKRLAGQTFNLQPL
jgi:hypothetical protein